MELGALPPAARSKAADSAPACKQLAGLWLLAGHVGKSLVKAKQNPSRCQRSISALCSGASTVSSLRTVGCDMRWRRRGSLLGLPGNAYVYRST